MLTLVTGGAGYVGSVLVPLLLDAGHSVRVLDRLDSGGCGLLAQSGRPGFEFRCGDATDSGVMAEVLDGVDAIVHLAALVGYPACRRNPYEARRTNVGATRLLANLRDPNQPIVFASTGSVYGVVAGGMCTESTPLQPASLYARTKLESERLLLDAGNAVVLRFATAFGVSQRMRYDLLVNDFVRQALQDGKVRVYEGGARRTFIHVRDMARAIVLALNDVDRMAGEVYNVGDESMNVSKSGLAEMIRSVVDFSLCRDEFDEDADKRDYEVSYSKIRAVGFEPTLGLLDGINELVTAVRLTGSTGVLRDT